MSGIGDKGYMKKEEELFDLLGEINDKYYMEAMQEEPEYTSPVFVSRKRFSFLPAAAAFVLVIGLAASLVLLNNKGFFEDIAENSGENSGNEISLPLDIIETADLLEIVPVTDLNRAVSQVWELTVPADKQLTDSIEYFLKEHETLSPQELNCYTIDLNFDNTEEIALVSWEKTDIFIFELSGDTAVLNSVIKKDNADFKITEENFTNMGPYYGEDVQSKAYPKDAEVYYHFDYRSGTDDDFDITAAAIKYDWDNNKYYAESVLSYGITNSEGEWTDVRFFVGGERLDVTEENEEKFSELWYRHEKLSPIILPSDRNYCEKYVLEHYDELVPLAQYGYFSQPAAEDLCAYIIDLNFDGIDELVIVDWEHTPLFVFEHDPGTMSFNSLLGDDQIRAYITKENFEALAPFKDSESEKSYWYYLFDLNDNENEMTHSVRAIKYGKSASMDYYYTERVLAYGAKKENGDWKIFFREYLNFAPPGASSREISYEEFAELWNKHTALPPIYFSDIRDKMQEDYERKNHNAYFDFDTVGYDFCGFGDDYLIDENGNVTDINGNAEWDIKKDVIAYAMNEFKNGNLEYEGIKEQYNTGLRISDGKAYRYIDDGLKMNFLLVIWNPDLSNTELYSTALFRRCGGSYKNHHDEYPAFDISQIPDVKGADLYENRNFSEEQEALYEVVYPCYSHSVLFSEEKYGYRFELIAERVYKDASASADKFYCNGYSYVRITKLDNPDNVTAFYTTLGARDYIPIKESYYDYTLHVYELKDGLVMFNPDTDTSGHLTPFFTITENEDRSIDIGYLYGDYSDLMLETATEEYWVLDTDAQFEADYENNTLYYKDTAFVFDFSKVGLGYDRELGRFVPCFEAVKAEY